MIIALYIAVSGLLLTIAKWAFFPWIPFAGSPATASATSGSASACGSTQAPGTAPSPSCGCRWGRLAMLARSGRTRPGLPFIRRILGPVSNCSILIGRAHYRHGPRMPLDEHVVVTSPPRGGKTGWLASVILRYPGPVLSTTTKHDVFALTSGIRARRGPVHVFNPQSVGDVPSTFRWNPVDGSPTASQWAGQLAELRGHADKTAQTIRMTMSRALSFLADPALAAAVQPAPDSSFNIERYLRNPETQYLIAETRGEDSPLGRRAGGSMTTSDHDDALTAALIQIAAHADGLDGLDHQVAAITDQLAKLAARNTASGDLSPQRDASTLAAQAEWQTRLAPAAANQMAADTTTCRHTANGLGRPGTARRQQ